MLRAQIHLTKLARGLNLDVSVESARLDQVGSDLDDIESTVTQDFPQREQRISDLVRITGFGPIPLGGFKGYKVNILERYIISSVSVTLRQQKITIPK